MTPETFYKRPAQVKAVRFDGTNGPAIVDWIQENGGVAELQGLGIDSTPSLIIHTLEGRMTAAHGWWIVQGVVGEFHPVRHDIFVTTYQRTSTEQGS